MRWRATARGGSYMNSNGQPKLREVEEDLSGGMEMPSIGSIINRHDKDWKVTPLARAGLIKRNHSDRPRVS